jgi:probable HAF family extracellular repeat protein
LPGGAFFGAAFGVSADGSVVVGQGFSAAGVEAFRWQGGVMKDLGDLPSGMFSSRAYGVLAEDGAVVVGEEGWSCSAGRRGGGAERRGRRGRADTI